MRRASESEKLCFVPYYSWLLWSFGCRKHERPTFASLFIRHITNYSELEEKFAVNGGNVSAFFRNFRLHFAKLSIDCATTLCIDA